ncbi:MAG TPA: lactonase family protein [Cyclobacteriaceae bacterium]|nr:lactonase family protein [Cyclobacteriaceae bacterium]
MNKLYLIFSIGIFMSTIVEAQKPKEIVYVGTYTVRGSKGIYVYQFDRVKGKLNPIQIVETPASPTFLAIHPSGKFLYSVNRGAIDEMKNSGSVSSFSIDPKTGKLTLLNQRPSYGADPCHISIDKSGKWAFISNYTEGNFIVLPIFDDGLLGSSSDSRKHIGSSVNPDRQKKAFVHSAMISADNRFVLVSDLGEDRIYSYKLDVSNGRIDDAKKPYVSVKPGCGPRHLDFHPNGNVVYSAEELTSTVGVFSYDKATGGLTVMADSIPSLPGDFKGKNTAADIHVHPNGKYLYMSNRGHNSIALYSIEKNGMIKLIGQQDTKGKTPRNFLIDLKGEYALVGHQDSDTIVIFKIDPKTGKLRYSGNQVSVPSPVCLKMMILK